MDRDDGANRSTKTASPRTSGGATGRRFRPTLGSAVQAWRIKLWLACVGKGLFRFRIEVAGLEHLPPGEPLIVAAAPHRSWIDPLLVLIALPTLPRPYFLSAAGVRSDRWWRRLALRLVGGMAPVERTGHLNREGLELALAILAHGNRVGIFPEGWVGTRDPDIQPLKRGVAFLSQHSGCRVLPVSLAGTTELWRGKTLRVGIAPPLPALAPGASRVEEQAYVDRLQTTLQEVLPAPPPEPVNGKKPWRWLTHLG